MTRVPDGRARQWTVRRAVSGDAAAVADVWLRSRRAAAGVPAPVHSGAEVRAWIADVVVAELDCWVATGEDGSIAGIIALRDETIDQLYVAPESQASGAGAALLACALARRPRAALELWTFAANTNARRFYERHGFVAVESTDGSGNEEGAPDVRYRRPAGL